MHAPTKVQIFPRNPVGDDALIVLRADVGIRPYES